MIDQLMSWDPGFADTVLMIIISLAGMCFGALVFFAPMMASRGSTASEKRGQVFGCLGEIVAMAVLFYAIVEIFV